MINAISLKRTCADAQVLLLYLGVGLGRVKMTVLIKYTNPLSPIFVWRSVEKDASRAEILLKDFNKISTQFRYKGVIFSILIEMPIHLYIIVSVGKVYYLLFTRFSGMTELYR